MLNVMPVSSCRFVPLAYPASYTLLGVVLPRVTLVTCARLDGLSLIISLEKAPFTAQVN